MSGSRSLEMLRAIMIVRGSAAIAWSGGAAIFLTALIARLELDSLPAAVGFVTFYPAIVVTTAFAGWRVGATMIALSAVATWWLLGVAASVPMPTIALAVVVFLICGILILVVTEAVTGAAVAIARDLDAASAMASADPASAATQSDAAAAPLRYVRTVLRSHRPEEQTPRTRALLDAIGLRVDMLECVSRAFPRADARRLDWGARMRRACADMLTSADAAALRVAIDAVPLVADRARTMALSLVLGELLVQCIEQFRADGTAGRFDASLREPQPGRFLLTVHGPRADAPTAAPAIDGLGMRILQSLTADLDASMVLSRDAGAVVRIEFSA